jgi:L-lactate dehydrogenase (cytochrome)
MALPDIADAVQDRLTVLADSGVRSGLDVVRMLAKGAKGVLLGRAWLFALAARGGSGVTQLLDMIASEMRVAMTLTGAQRIGEINTSTLADESCPASCARHHQVELKYAKSDFADLDKPG